MPLRWFVLISLLLGTVLAQGSPRWRVLYRPDLVPSPGTVRPDHANLLTPQALNALPRACRARTAQVVSARRGQFIQAASSETLYQFRSDCNDALRFVVVRGSRVVHGGVLARPNPMAQLTEAYVLQDIDRDGRQEVGTVFEVADGAGGARWLSVWSLASREWVRPLATFWTARWRCDPVDSTSAGRVETWTLFVQPGRIPRFTADAWVYSSCGEGSSPVLGARKGAPAQPRNLRELYW